MGKPIGKYCFPSNRFPQFLRQFNLIMQQKNLLLKKNCIPCKPIHPDVIKQHDITDMASTFKNANISIYIQHHMYTGIYLQPPGQVFLKLKPVSPPFHCFSILSAYFQDKILIKNYVPLTQVLFRFNFEMLLASKHLKFVTTQHLMSQT